MAIDYTVYTESDSLFQVPTLTLIRISLFALAF